MDLLVDIFGLVSVLLQGAIMTAQSLALGGCLFLLFLALPFAPQLRAGERLVRYTRQLAGASAIVLGVAAIARGTIVLLLVEDTAGLTFLEAAGATAVMADLVSAVAAFLLALVLFGRPRPERLPLVALCLVALGAQLLTSHAVARLGDRTVPTLATFMHELAAAAWIGGIPYFLIALALPGEADERALVGRRFSRISMVSVALLLAGGLAMSVAYIGSFAALWGTAYGLMVVTKMLLLGILLLLGAHNFFAVEALRRHGTGPLLRLRRFAEAEIGIGISVLFAAASLTSLPPAVDLTQNRLTIGEIAARFVPTTPRLTSPDHSSLAVAQAQLQSPQAYVPGSGNLPPRDSDDAAWSEYNHNWAGILMLAIGLLALAERGGRVPWARNWPLLFVALAAFLFFRNDPEAWPLGTIGFWESLRDPDTAQHRFYVLLTLFFGLFEWAVRTDRIRARGAALVFPIVTGVGGVLLLTHSHPLGNIREQLLIEVTHIPLAVLGIIAAWTRWLELRLDAPTNRVPAWTWRVCFVAVGLLLLFYRET